MAARRGESDGSVLVVFALLHGGPGIGFACVVLGEEDVGGFAGREAHQGVLPIADVVAEAEADFVAEVVGIEVKPEGVEDVVGFSDSEENGGGRGVPVGSAGVLRGGGGGGDVGCAGEPGGAGLDVVV